MSLVNIAPGETLILASQSPRRRELLAGIGIEPEVVPADIDESVRDGERAHEYVERLAEEKARVIGADRGDAWILAADTTVTVAGEILGKPGDGREAKEMLAKLSAATHEVWGGVALIHEQREVSVVESIVTKVHFAPLCESAIDRYVASGEPMDKAGAYAVQGLGAAFIRSIRGSYTNVVGLDLSYVAELFLEHGVVEVCG